MSKIKTKTIKLSPIKVVCTDKNSIAFSVIPKRKATSREAIHILKNILGFDIDTAFFECETRNERKEMVKELTDSLNRFLDGGYWCYLCEDCFAYEDKDMFNFAFFLQMVSYCQEKGIL